MKYYCILIHVFVATLISLDLDISYHSQHRPPLQMSIAANKPGSSSINKNKNSGDFSTTIPARKTRSSNKKTAARGNAETLSKEKLDRLNAPRTKTCSVGQNYQVSVQYLEPVSPLSDGYPGHPVDECLWNAHNGLNDDDVFNYCCEANTHFGIGPDRALYILLKSGFDLENARAELPKRTIFKQNFSFEDAYAFKNALMYFGKNFAKVKQVLPHKSMAGLVEHYYLTKKQQNYKSFMDTETARSKSDDDIESDEEVNSHRGTQKGLHVPICENCKNRVLKLYPINGLELCCTCKLYFKATNKHRVCAQPVADDEGQRRVVKCPPDMRQIADQFAEMARISRTFVDADDSGDLQVAKCGKTVCQMKYQEMKKEQMQVKARAQAKHAALQQSKGPSYNYTPEDATRFLLRTAQHKPLPSAAAGSTTGTATGTSHRRVGQQRNWTSREKQAALNALILFNGDCETVAEIMTTKTPDMVKVFYKENEQRIQQLIKEQLEEAEKTNFLLPKEERKQSAPVTIELE